MYGLALVLLAGLLVSGCGSSDGSGDSTPSPGTTPPAVQPIPPPVSTARTWAIHGQLGAGRTLDGTFTYEKAATPSAEHVRGLSPNVVYPLTAWDIHVHVGQVIGTNGLPLPGREPDVFFKQTGFVDTSELCFNHCTFASTDDVAKLIFANGLQTLVLTFVLPAPHTALPVEVGDWGVFEPRGSFLQEGNLTDRFPIGEVVTRYLIVVRELDITAE